MLAWQTPVFALPLFLPLFALDVIGHDESSYMKANLTCSYLYIRTGQTMAS